MTRHQDGITFIYNEDGNEPAKVYYMYPSEEFYLYENLDIPIPIEFEEMIFDNDNDLVGIKSKIIYSQKNGFYPMIQQVGLNSLALGLEQEIIIGSDLGLKLLKPNTEISSFVPNAPASSKFTALKVLQDGRLVGASSNGLSIKDFNGWRNILEVKVNGSDNINNYYDYGQFIADTIPFDFGDAVADIEEGPDGLVYLAIEGTYPSFSNPERQGGGILILDVDNPANITVIDTSIFSYYTSSSSSRPYIVVKDIEFDQLGNLWVANAYSTNKNTPIHVRNVDNIWKSYGSSETSAKISQSPISLAFDNWSRPWFGAFKAEEANLGVYPDGRNFCFRL